MPGCKKVCPAGRPSTFLFLGGKNRKRGCDLLTRLLKPEVFSRATAASRSAEKGIGHPLICCEGPKPAPAAPGLCLSEFIDDGVCPNIRKIITKCRLRGGICNFGKCVNMTVGWCSRNFGFRVSAGAKLLNTAFGWLSPMR